MSSSHTIIAWASAPGWSRRAIVRLSGPLCPSLAARLLSIHTWTRQAVKKTLTLGARSLPVLVMCFPSPASYTCEDSLELIVPGNPHVITRVCEEFLALGVTMATRGEFTARAFQNGRLGLSQAEGVAAMIAASTDEELAAATLLLRGRTGEQFRAWREEVATVTALVEAGIDFSDQEDVVAISRPALLARLRKLMREVEEHLGENRATVHDSSMLRVALVGQPNAGKSTLLNALVGRERAIASPLAGTTRDVLVEPLTLSRSEPRENEQAVLLMDLPGLSSASLSSIEIDEQSQRLAREQIESANLLVWCDQTGRFDAEDLPIQIPKVAAVLKVRTFGDRPSEHDGREDLTVCAIDGWHVQAVRERIFSMLAHSRHAHGAGAIVPGRHRQVLTKVIAVLAAVSDLCTSGDHETAPPQRQPLQQPEIVADLLREALAEVGELVGHVTTDDLLGRVFSSFCVGK